MCSYVQFNKNRIWMKAFFLYPENLFMHMKEFSFFFKSGFMKQTTVGGQMSKKHHFSEKVDYVTTYSQIFKVIL